MICVAFLQILPKIHFITPFIKSSHHGAVGSASAWQTRGSRVELVMMR